jgi:fatty acid desaturase
MKFSRKDLILVALTVAHLFILIASFIYPLSTFEFTLSAIALILMIGTNYQCISHNFIHTPFFNSSKLNNIFSVINSLCLGLPQSIYQEHHLNHHRYNNDPVKDDSSLYKYGNDGMEESVLKYSFLGVFRTDLKSLFRRARKTSGMLVVFELAAIIVMHLVMIKTSFVLYIFLYLVTWYLGQVFALLENYSEHHDAKLYDRKRDSVSCYDKTYNLLWFNNGFHQEHHYRPMVHWTKIKQVTKELPLDRKTTRFFHLTNLN